jgi:hypothetical protein
MAFRLVAAKATANGLQCLHMTRGRCGDFDDIGNVELVRADSNSDNGEWS